MKEFHLISSPGYTVNKRQTSIKGGAYTIHLESRYPVNNPEMRIYLKCHTSFLPATEQDNYFQVKLDGPQPQWSNTSIQIFLIPVENDNFFGRNAGKIKFSKSS